MKIAVVTRFFDHLSVNHDIRQKSIAILEKRLFYVSGIMGKTKKPRKGRGSEPSVMGEIAQQAVKDCPDVPSLRLARSLFTRHPDVFSSVEQARSRIRYYRGLHGDENRKHVRNTGGDHLFREFGDQADFADIYDLIPEPIEQLSDWAPVNVKGNRLLVFSDVHIPFHDPGALRVMLEYAQEIEVDSLLLNGDIIDFYALSRWEKDPRLRNFGKEVNDTIRFLSLLRRIWPKEPIYFKQGNHEIRYISYMCKRAPDLLGLAAFDFDELLCLEELGIQHIESSAYAMFGRLPIIHGHEFRHGFAPPVNPARGLWLRAKESAMCGHHHQTSSHSEKRMRGRVETTFSTGCLCNLHPSYMPNNNWNHGFAVIDRVEDDGFQVQNKKIIDGRVFAG